MQEKNLNIGLNQRKTMNSYSCIDLDIIKEKVSSFASIEEAKTFIIDEDVEYNPLIIKQKALETSEAMNILKKEINVQFSGIKNVNDILDSAQKDITLSGEEIAEVLVFHNHCERICKIFKNIDEDINLKDYTDSINLSNNIFDEINRCIDNSGEIKENASSLLLDLNKKISNLEKSLYSKAEQFVSKHLSSLQESQIYTRENRIVFLIKNSDKNKYQGYTYGSSASGLACYVEPQMFVEMNNEIISLLHDKEDEINRILKQLTYYIATVSLDYKRNFESLIKLNVIFAKANYGIKNDCIIPEFVEGVYFDFKDLCHPLLDKKTVVSNSYRLFEPYKGIVISGSNTGGKTVSLKAIGLSLVMSYIGIPIMASRAQIPIYKNIYVDIDDNQSIVDSLSTFSAHITNINDIVNNADDHSLILIDELISGTDPKEAQAISLAILDKIKEIGSIFVITTHFDDIKNYSYDDENIMLSSVGFDMETLKPTYKYHENSIGSSNALQIASRYFDDSKIIDKANYYIEKSQTDQDKLFQKLSLQMEDINKEKEKINDLKKDYENLLNELKKERNEFINEKQTIKDKYIDELNQYIEDIKNKALNKLDSIKDKKDINAIKEIEELSSVVIQEEKVVFNVGDNVRISENEQIGTILQINSNKATIDIRGITVKADLNDLKLMPKIQKKEVYHEKKRINNVSKEINLVGQRVEDGIALLEDYLDRANGAHLSSVKVIHGYGTGALRKAIRDRIKKLSYVKTFSDGDFYDGGSAVTIVEFK